jgi:hypothetical protein
LPTAPVAICEKIPDPIYFMKKTRRCFRSESHVFQTVRLPAMMTEMMLSSIETIARRSWMLAQGKCSPTECMRMVLEKQQALALSGFALLRGASAASILAPFHRGVTANAKRLRQSGKRQRRKGEKNNSRKSQLDDPSSRRSA